MVYILLCNNQKAGRGCRVYRYIPGANRRRNLCLRIYCCTRAQHLYFSSSFFSRYHSRFLKGAAIGKQELINQYIKNSYIGIIFISETGREKCALSFQDGYAIGDIISRKERIFMFKTFISKDLLRKDQKFAKAYDQLQEQNLMNYIMSLENPNEFLLNEYSSYLNSKL